jgi:hypothetical protein
MSETTPAISGEQFNQLLAALIAGQQMNAEQTAKMAAALQKSADIQQKMIPENVNAPDISAYNPEGERDHPRPELPAKQVWFGGFPIERDLASAEELSLLHQLQPGEYWVTRNDDEREIVPVIFDKSETGQIWRIRIAADTGKEAREKWPALKKVLREIVEQVPAAA